MTVSFQDPNPLDLVFFAYDQAADRLGLPKGNTHVIWELDDRLDLERFVEAVRGLHATYPVTASRLEYTRWMGHPRWRFTRDPGMAERAVVLEEVDDDRETARSTWLESLPYRPLELATGPPLVWHIRRGPSGRDLCVLRYPHALMDARGGLWIHEELDRIWGERPNVESLRTAGDEARADFGSLLDPLSLWQRVKLFRDAMRRGRALASRPRRLCEAPMPADLGRLRRIWRHFTPEQTVVMRDCSERCCGVGRVADFIRACALRALHEIMPSPSPPDAAYALLNVFERRNRRQPLRLLSNLNTSVPIVIAAPLAGDIARVADEIREQTGRRLAEGVALEHACTLWFMTRLPTSWLGAAIAANLRPARASRRGGAPRRASGRFGLAPPPSLPLGLIGPASRPMRTFCGAGVGNYYGFSPPVPDSGFTITLNITEARLNLSALCYENRVPVEQVTRLLNRCAALLLE